MIVAGSNAPYDAYLFSCCTKAGICDQVTDPDPCSQAILDRFSRLPGCGPYKLSPTAWNWNNILKQWYLAGEMQCIAYIGNLHYPIGATSKKCRL
jgi:hypothetical protein